MKILHLVISTLISLSCTNSTSEKEANNNSTVGQVSDSSKWTDSFLELKKAITTGNRVAVKKFVDFPIKNKGNEIWYLADSRLVMEISSKEIKPFTESDFDKYFSSIFALDLRKTFEKLNTEEFFRTSKSTSPEIEIVKDSKSKLVASYDSSKHKITLALVSTLPEQANDKFTIYYMFDVLNNQNIKFAEVRVE